MGTPKTGNPKNMVGICWEYIDPGIDMEAGLTGMRVSEN